jgi:hypothetical protein
MCVAWWTDCTVHYRHPCGGQPARGVLPGTGRGLDLAPFLISKGLVDTLFKCLHMVFPLEGVEAPFLESTPFLNGMFDVPYCAIQDVGGPVEHQDSVAVQCCCTVSGGRHLAAL